MVANCAPVSRIRSLVSVVLSALMLCLALPGTPLAQETATAHGQIKLWDQALTRIEAALGESRTILPGDSIDYQASLNAILANARGMRAAESRRVPGLRVQLESLGTAPAEGQPSEDEEVARKRRLIANDISLAEGRVKQSDLAIARANALLAEIGRMEQAEIQGQILATGPLPIGIETWSNALSQDLLVMAGIGQSLAQWWANIRLRSDRVSLLAPALFLLLAILLAFPVRRLILRRWGPNAANPAPSYARRLAAATASSVARILLPVLVVGAATFLFLLSLAGNGASPLRSLALEVGGHIVWFLVVTGLAISAFSPRLPAWRIMPVPAEASAQLAGQVVVGSGLILAFGILQAMLVNPATGGPGLHARGLIVLLNALVAVVVFMPALQSRYWRIESGQLVSKLSRVLRGGAALAILVALGAAILGYANLSEHVLKALSITAVLVGIVFLARALVGETLRAMFSPDGRYFARVSDATGVTPESGRRLIFWVRMLSELVIWPPSLYLLLIAYGISPSLLDTWAAQTLQGITIGNFTISLTDLGAALATVIVGFLAVGSLRRWMRERVMPNTGLDRGLQNSIATGVGYLGGIAVLLLGIVMLGIDLGNLALVAGALSVGMGFGLKTIVENFVAGILLLIERPVKAGDWIVVGTTEGIVKSISVRSTEIETFDRSSVILPNSELIASPVVNWTHKNRIARVIVKASIATGNDPRLAEKIMVRCAEAHPRVMRHPAPSVVFRAMAATLQLELRCFVADTDYYLPVLSDLNFAIFEAFRAEGVTLPG